MVVTHHVEEDTDAPSPWGAPVARDEALDAHLLRSAEDLLLVADDAGVHGAQEDLDALQVLLQLVEIVGHVSDADLDPLCLQGFCGRLRHGCRADESRNTLDQANEGLVVLC